MQSSWKNCKNILVIRPDNMGDLLMSTPAIRALRETFSCRITVLTSSMAAGIVAHVPEIDAVITYDLPWVKVGESVLPDSFPELAEMLREKAFDAAVVFTVYSQNPMPSIMLAWLAGIPRRLAYCRENPYGLLTDWVPDEEPYTLVRHQVQRDLELVKTVGAKTSNEALSLARSENGWPETASVLAEISVNIQKPWLILHAGVSEEKRAYPSENWVAIAKRLISELGYQVLFTGGKGEATLTESLAAQTGTGAFSLGGKLSLEGFMNLIQRAPLLLTVNSGPAHIAAALKTPVVVLYALTNPQHLPWQVRGKALFYSVPRALWSQNEVVRFVQENLQPQDVPVPTAAAVFEALRDVISGKAGVMPVLAPLRLR